MDYNVLYKSWNLRSLSSLLINNIMINKTPVAQSITCTEQRACGKRDTSAGRGRTMCKAGSDTVFSLTKQFIIVLTGMQLVKHTHAKS